MVFFLPRYPALTKRSETALEFDVAAYSFNASKLISGTTLRKLLDGHDRCPAIGREPAAGIA